MRSGGCVPLSLRVCVDEIFGKNTWDALSRRYEDLCENQPVRRVRPGSLGRRGTGIATPSSRRRVDGVEDDAMIQHERAVKF